MDPGTAIAVVCRGLQTCQSLLDYYMAWKDFNDDIRVAYKTIAQLHDTLAELEAILSQIDGDRKAHIEAVVQDCKDNLLKLDNKTQYPFRRETLLKLQRIVHEVQNQLTLAIQVLDLGVGLRLNNSIYQITLDLQDVGANVADISQQNEHALSLLQSQTLEKARQWLDAPEQESFHKRMLEWHEEGTGTWLISSAIYVQWKTGEQRHLWLYGKAGCGKTVVSATIIQDIREHYKARADIGYAMFYFAFDNTCKQSYRDCLASLVLQVCDRSSANSELLLAYTLLEATEKNAHPDVDKLESIFLTLVKPYNQFFLVLDALDESPEHYVGHRTTRQILLSNLVELSQKCSNLRILATSRDLIDIQEYMGVLGARPVSMPAEFINKDIRTFVTNQLAVDPKLHRFSLDLKTKIERVLIEKADGMFRWAYCQLRELKSLRSLRPSYVESILGNLPSTLDETYHRILQQIKPQLRKDAIVLLRWIAFAKEPLTLAALSHALLINLDTEYGSVAIEDCGSVEDALNILPGLIMIIDGDQPLEPHNSDAFRLETGEIWASEDISTKRVRLAHFSIKEYLVSSRILESNVKSFHLSSPTMEQFLSDSCIVYLMYCASEQVERTGKNDLEVFPLLSYTGNYWHKHLKSSSDLQKQILFLQSRTSTNYWISKFWPSQYLDAVLSLSSDSMVNRGLLIASCLGLDSIARELVTHGADINAPLGLGVRPPLIAAVAEGHESTVRMLVEEHNADVMVEYSDPPLLRQPQTALHKAIVSKYEQIALVLLASYKGRRLIDKYLMRTLYLAAYYGQVQVIRVLLTEYGIDVDARHPGFDQVWFVASSRGQEHIIRMMVDEYKADVNAHNTVGETALMLAAGSGSFRTVETLLGHSANVNLLDDNGKNCLHHAAHGRDSGAPEVTQAAIFVRLVSLGDLELSMKDKSNWTALDYARITKNDKLFGIIAMLENKTSNISSSTGDSTNDVVTIRPLL